MYSLGGVLARAGIESVFICISGGVASGLNRLRGVSGGVMRVVEEVDEVESEEGEEDLDVEDGEFDS